MVNKIYFSIILNIKPTQNIIKIIAQFDWHILLGKVECAKLSLDSGDLMDPSIYFFWNRQGFFYQFSSKFFLQFLI